ncbi:U3 small nucleolar RNA-associated protein 4 [Nymphon striatum]|nr:U3 small nucleolar RNA-associated protein 4 [Nymphon striatum]
MRKLRIHHVKLYQPEPTAIHCLSYEESSQKLAVSRSDNSIEIWDFNASPHKEGEITLDADEGSIEALVWCDNRLFSTGLQGFIAEYDLNSLAIKHKEHVVSGPAWCLSLSHDKSLLAAGTENGDICIYTVLPCGIKYFKNLTKQETRVLSLSWFKNSFIVSGSLDVLKIWNIETGRAIQRMTTGRSNKNQETIVWCVKFLSDFTVISGDSRGKTCFWNGNTGSLIVDIQSHKADVLCIEVDKDENKLYSAGVDPMIVEFCKIITTRGDTENNTKWIKSGTRKIHTHDVRALVNANKYLTSGGVDSYLAFSKYSPKVCLKYPQTSHVRENEEILPFSSDPMKLLVLKCKSDAKITSSAISEDAQWISYSTNSKIMLYQFSIVDENEFTPKVTLNPVYSLPSECTSARLLSFLPDCKKLVVVSSSSQVQVISLDALQATLLHIFPSIHEKVHLVSISNDGKFAATANNDSEIQIYNLENLTVHCTLPKYRCQPSAMSFQPDTNHVVVVYTDHKVVIFDVMKREYTKWSRNLMSRFPKGWENQTNVFTSITFDSSDPNSFILQSDNSLAVIEDLDHLVFFGQIEDNEMLAVELPPSVIFDKLPSALKQKKFGT